MAEAQRLSMELYFAMYQCRRRLSGTKGRAPGNPDRRLQGGDGAMAGVRATLYRSLCISCDVICGMVKRQARLITRAAWK